MGSAGSTGPTTAPLQRQRRNRGGEHAHSKGPTDRVWMVLLLLTLGIVLTGLVFAITTKE